MEFLTFHVGEREFAVDLGRVREIVTPPPITRVPGMPPALLGLVGLRGDPTAVIDAGLRLAGRRTSISGRTPILVLTARIREQATAVGLLVEASGRKLDVEELLPWNDSQARFAGADACIGFADVDGALVLVLDVDQLLAFDRIATAGALALPAAREAGPLPADPPGAATATTAEGSAALIPAASLPANLIAADPLPAAPGRMPAASSAPVESAPPRPTPSHAARALPAVPLSGAMKSRALSPLPRVAASPVHTPMVIEPAARPAPARPPSGTWRAFPGDRARDDSPLPASAPPRFEPPAVDTWAAPAHQEPRVAAAPPERRGRRFPWFVAAAAGVLLLLLAAVRGMFGESDRATEARSPAAAQPPPASVARAAEQPVPAPSASPPPPPPPPLTASAPAPPEPPPPDPLPSPPPVATPPAPAARPARTLPASMVVTPDTPACEIHEVKKGDTLWWIAAHKLGDPLKWPVLFGENRDRIANPNLIEVNDRIRIPGACAPRSAR